ncbi:MAG: hypothetical protein AB8G22_17055, partial [Saprospiraceae bacterium]
MKFRTLTLFIFILSIYSCKNEVQQVVGDKVKESQLYEGPIIDMHIHAYNEELGGSMFGMNQPNPLKNETYKA